MGHCLQLEELEDWAGNGDIVLSRLKRHNRKWGKLLRTWHQIPRGPTNPPIPLRRPPHSRELCAEIVIGPIWPAPEIAPKDFWFCNLLPADAAENALHWDA